MSDIIKFPVWLRVVTGHPDGLGQTVEYRHPAGWSIVCLEGRWQIYNPLGEGMGWNRTLKKSQQEAESLIYGEDGDQ